MAGESSAMTPVNELPNKTRPDTTSRGPVFGQTVDQTKPTVLVLGGYGFIGRYTVAALKHHRVEVLIGTRGQGDARVSAHERHLKLHENLTIKSWDSALQGVTAVVNAVGILRERPGETFDKVHHQAVGALAASCANRNIPLVHVSALGIEEAVENEFCRSKQRGEDALRRSACRGAIVRASVVDAPDGYGSGWFHRLAQWPVWLLPASATRLLSPITAADLGQALANLVLQKTPEVALSTPAEILEVGCGQTFTLETYLHKLRRPNADGTTAPLVILRVPELLARASARFFDWVHLTPYSIGHHELLGFDNIPQQNSLPAILGRSPTPIGVEQVQTQPVAKKPELLSSGRV